ncbi:flagellar hook-length control protein FliK [Paracoccus jiaweipingae]|uniref:flagellar hook-length control protein FliK n=1 Tax=unclassified Paracoccus (in: a-proteobacteria) TaxID=2688777 RepID=UPI003793F4AF
MADNAHLTVDGGGAKPDGLESCNGEFEPAGVGIPDAPAPLHNGVEGRPVLGGHEHLIGHKNMKSQERGDSPDAVTVSAVAAPATGALPPHIPVEPNVVRPMIAAASPGAEVARTPMKKGDSTRLIAMGNAKDGPTSPDPLVLNTEAPKGADKDVTLNEAAPSSALRPALAADASGMATVKHATTGVVADAPSEPIPDVDGGLPDSPRPHWQPIAQASDPAMQMPSIARNGDFENPVRPTQGVDQRPNGPDSVPDAEAAESALRAASQMREGGLIGEIPVGHMVPTSRRSQDVTGAEEHARLSPSPDSRQVSQPLTRGWPPRDLADMPNAATSQHQHAGGWAPVEGKGRPDMTPTQNRLSDGTVPQTDWAPKTPSLSDSVPQSAQADSPLRRLTDYRSDALPEFRDIILPRTGPAGAPGPVTGLAQSHKLETVTVQVSQAARSGDLDQIEVRLDPQELGLVKMTFQREADHTRVMVWAERPEVMDQLRRNADILLRDLRDAGMPRPEMHFGQDRSSQDRPDGRAHVSHFSMSSPDMADMIVPASAQILGQGKIDIRF